MAEVIFDGTCQIHPDEKDELDLLLDEQNTLARPKENCSKNKIELF